MSAKIRSVSSVSGILITVGLLGTVIGLIITVGGISQVLDAAGQDYEAMVGGLNTRLRVWEVLLYDLLWWAFRERNSAGLIDRK